MEYETITFDEEIHRTENAVLYQLDDERHWVPLSVIREEVQGPNSTEVEVAVWWATKNNLV